MKHQHLSMIAALGLISLLGFVGCEREEREPHSIGPEAAISEPITPGEQTPRAKKPYPAEDNAYTISQGKQIYSVFNCVGCHAHGGGGMGPALIDQKWHYGSAPQDIYRSIIDGRPNGMPSFGGKIPEQQVWQLVAYVRSLGGISSSIPAPGRDDHMKSKPPENTLPRQQPNAEPIEPRKEPPR